MQDLLQIFGGIGFVAMLIYAAFDAVDWVIWKVGQLTFVGRCDKLIAGREE